MTYLVTGTAGFIGNFVALALLERGEAVIGVDNLTPYYDVTLKEARLKRLSGLKKFTEARIDIADMRALKQVFATHKPDIVINLAAQAGVRYSIDQPHDYLHSNLEGFLNVLECCRHGKVEHLLYASTSSAYGANAQPPFKETDSADHPVSFYAATKRANELMAHSYSYLYGIPTSGLRFFTVYGPWGRPDMAYFKFTKAITDGTPIDIYNAGEMFRDFTYIDDIVDGIIKLCGVIPSPYASLSTRAPILGSSPVAPFEIYNIGNRKVVNLMDFIEILEDKIGKKAIKNMMPMQPGDVHLTHANTDKLSSVTGFSPDTKIEDGIEKFVKWYKGFYG
ncbi:MAG: NAD-dependent epimerase [Hellea sp.]|nr:NAD-dependent epimerase [Hellea sp.]